MYKTPCLCSIGFFDRTDKASHTSFRNQKPASGTSACSISKMLLLALSLLPGRSGFVLLHNLTISVCEPARTRLMWIRKLKRKFWYSASFPSNVGGLSKPLTSSRKSAVRVFHHWAALCFSEDHWFFMESAPLPCTLRSIFSASKCSLGFCICPLIPVLVWNCLRRARDICDQAFHFFRQRVVNNHDTKVEKKQRLKCADPYRVLSHWWSNHHDLFS